MHSRPDKLLCSFQLILIVALSFAISNSILFMTFCRQHSSTPTESWTEFFQKYFLCQLWQDSLFLSRNCDRSSGLETLLAIFTIIIFEAYLIYTKFIHLNGILHFFSRQGKCAWFQSSVWIHKHLLQSSTLFLLDIMCRNLSNKH